MKKILMLLLSTLIMSCSLRDLALNSLRIVGDNGIIGKEKMRLLYNYYYSTDKPQKLKGKFGYFLLKHEIKNENVTYYHYFNERSDNLVLMVHGGAFETRLGQQYIELMDDIFSNTRAKFEAYLLDYKTSYKYPSQQKELEALLEHAMKKYKKIILIGDSSGGNIILTTMLKLRDENKKLPDALVLMSAWTDITNSVESRKTRFYDDPIIGNEQFPQSLVNNYYVSEVKDLKNPYVSPIYGSYENFPKTLIHVGNAEVLLDDSLVVYRKMKKVNVDVEISVFDKMFHVFQLINFLPEAQVAYKQIGEFMTSIFEK
ncbi:alpha/beta hydrolase [Caviibacter abscessus]|uniref:alpha/beta hydrolase n=1 Tax=Caviibacter abscessus TaxID=1766719 RepID=UPI00082AF03A|nr:alpha/beta hydrolase [Caviibacter abscessus]